MSERVFVSDHIFDELREIVGSHVDKKRYEHTLSVERKAISIAELFCPEKTGVLRAAAILHDLTKSFSTEEHIAVLEKYGYPIPDPLAPPVLHAVTAPLIILNELSERYGVLNDPEILSAVRWHATGRNNMTLTETVIYLADYIEDTRTFDECVRVRDYFDSGLSADRRNNYLHLYKTMVISFGYTITDMTENRRFIDPNTIDAWNYFLKLSSEAEKGKAPYEI